jgi:hypothetical protein
LTVPNVEEITSQLCVCVNHEKNDKLNMVRLIYWVVTPCGLVGRYQHFSKNIDMYLTTSPQGVTTQKTNTDIFTL